MKKEDAVDVIIVGAGLSGLGCAKKLSESGKSFLLISEDVGGRVCTSPNGKVNYGAYYITKDCKQIWPFITDLHKMQFGEYHFHRNGRHYHFISLHAFRYIFQVIRLALDLRVFRRHMNRSRRLGVEQSRKEITENDPVLRKYYHQTAGEYIKERRIEPLVKEYLEQVLWGSFFVDPRTVPTYIFLQCMLPMIVPSFAFRFDFAKLTAPFKDSLRTDTITSVEKEGELYHLHSKSGTEYFCKRLVLATPMWITNTLVAPQPVKKTVDVSYYHVTGTLRPEFEMKGFDFFDLDTQTALSHERDGSYLYFYCGPDKIDTYFLEYKIIEKRAWAPALILMGDQYISENPDKNLYIATDHDFPSTEDAFIAGLYVGGLVVKNWDK